MAGGFRVLENGDSRISEASEFRVTQEYFWDGPRETEAGDLRITEASVFRVTENFLEGENAVQGIGTLTALQSYKTFGYFDIGAEGFCASVATKVSPGATTLTGTGTLGPTGYLEMPVNSSVNGTGSITSSASVGKYGFSNLNSLGSISVTPKLILNGISDLQTTGTHLFASIGMFIGHTHNFNGVSTVSTNANIVAYRSLDLNAIGSISALQNLKATGSLALNATGSISPSGTRIRYGATNLSAAGSLAVIPTPKFYGLFNKTGTGTLAADGTDIDFTSTMYYKVGASWKTNIPYVKRSGTWVSPTAIYKNISGSWKRVY
jgi:hypothetical protein